MTSGVGGPNGGIPQQGFGERTVAAAKSLYKGSKPEKMKSTMKRIMHPKSDYSRHDSRTKGQHGKGMAFLRVIGFSAKLAGQVTVYSLGQTLKGIKAFGLGVKEKYADLQQLRGADDSKRGKVVDGIKATGITAGKGIAKGAKFLWNHSKNIKETANKVAHPRTKIQGGVTTEKHYGIPGGVARFLGQGALLIGKATILGLGVAAIGIANFAKDAYEDYQASRAPAEGAPDAADTAGDAGDSLGARDTQSEYEPMFPLGAGDTSESSTFDDDDDDETSSSELTDQGPPVASTSYADSELLMEEVDSSFEGEDEGRDVFIARLMNEQNMSIEDAIAAWESLQE